MPGHRSTRRPQKRLFPWHGVPAASPPLAPPARFPVRALIRLRAGATRSAAWAYVGAACGGGAAAALGALLAIVFAVRRGLIPDAGTTVAVGLLGVILFMFAGGFLGALAGAAVGAVAGWAAGMRRPGAEFHESALSPSQHEEGV